MFFYAYNDMSAGAQKQQGTRYKSAAKTRVQDPCVVGIRTPVVSLSRTPSVLLRCCVTQTPPNDVSITAYLAMPTPRFSHGAFVRTMRENFREPS